MEQLIAHLFGDYVLQTDHMADRKTKSMYVALAHACSYALPFLFLDPSWVAVAAIILTHALIDRFRLARFLIWGKNQVAPQAYRYPFSKAMWHGYQDGKPDWLAGWLYIIADNALHLAINYFALRYL